MTVNVFRNQVIVFMMVLLLFFAGLVFEGCSETPSTSEQATTSEKTLDGGGQAESTPDTTVQPEKAVTQEGSTQQEKIIVPEEPTQPEPIPEPGKPEPSSQPDTIAVPENTTNPEQSGSSGKVDCKKASQIALQWTSYIPAKVDEALKLSAFPFAYGGARKKNGKLEYGSKVIIITSKAQLKAGLAKANSMSSSFVVESKLFTAAEAAKIHLGKVFTKDGCRVALGAKAINDQIFLFVTPEQKVVALFEVEM